MAAAGSAALAPFDSDSEEVAALALKCLGHLFTWIPLANNLIGPRLLSIVFQFAALGAHPDTVRFLFFRSLSQFYFESKLQTSLANHSPGLEAHQPASINPCNSNLGILAMTAINEIVYKNCVPQDFEAFLLEMFKNAFQLLHAV